MPLMIFTALMLAQAPAAAQPSQSNRPIEVTQKKQSKQKCEYMEVTGSHTRQRICRDEFGNLDLGPNVTNSVAAGVLHPTPVAQPGGFGPTPQ